MNYVFALPKHLVPQAVQPFDDFLRERGEIDSFADGTHLFANDYVFWGIIDGVDHEQIVTKLEDLGVSAEFIGDEHAYWLDEENDESS